MMALDKKWVLLTTVFVFLFSNSYSQSQEILLNTNWFFKHHYNEHSHWLSATIPGTVHTDLLAHAQIPDPFLETNEQLVQWVDTCTWDYQTSFVLNDKDFKSVTLRFNGLDTYADVYLNDSLILRADNMFRSWTAEVSKLLIQGRNTLLVRFYPVAKMEKQKATQIPYTLPGDERVFTRKAAYQYGWDWGPRLITSGIWKPVMLIRQHGSLVLEDVHIQQISVDKQKVILNVATELRSGLKAPLKTPLIFVPHLAGFRDLHLKPEKGDAGMNPARQYEFLEVPLNQSVTISVFNDITNELLGSSTLPSTSTIKSRLNTRIEIQNPKLWWSNGLGDPYLYALRVEVSAGKDKIIQKYKVGIRTVELVQEPDSIGKSFYFKLNGRPVFAKGANIIPPDNFLPRVSTQQYRSIIEHAKEANMNMLRVWGGGVYMDDYFYELCDELGIMVWQDFMFANGMYPADDLFLENVKLEVQQQVVRLRNHPSVVLWCGNNEISEGWHNWGWQKQFSLSPHDSTQIWNGYHKIFEETIPEVLRQVDSTRAYWPSSPRHGWGRKASLLEGDLHYWGVWWGLQPFEVYNKKVGRFMSEYGFQGMPSVETFQRFTKELSFESASVKQHQKHPTGYETIEQYRQHWYRKPNSFHDYVYQSQLLQAEGMKIAIEAHRRSMPYSMGTLYWQLNDCWPVTSWSSIDYYETPKAAHYFIKKAFSNTIVSIVPENKSYQIYFVSDTLRAQRLTLNSKIINFDGVVRWSSSTTFHASENASQLMASIDSVMLAAKIDFSRSVWVATVLNEAGSVVATTNFYFVKPKALVLSKAAISIKRKSKQAIVLRSPALVKNVLVTPKVPATFSDNFFDILPNQEVIVQVVSEWPLKKIIKNIQVKSLVDTYENP